jgi:hypothetical protein
MINIVVKAQQVVACVMEEPKPWEMGGKAGVVHSARLACVDSAGEVASIKLKAKSEAELKQKMAAYTIGKPADIRVKEIIPVFRSGDRKPTDYEFVG